MVVQFIILVMCLYLLKNGHNILFDESYLQSFVFTIIPSWAGLNTLNRIQHKQIVPIGKERELKSLGTFVIEIIVS